MTPRTDIATGPGRPAGADGPARRTAVAAAAADGPPARAARAARAPARTDLQLDDGRVLRAHVWPGRGTPVVLLHGLLDCADGWAELCQASSRPCIAFDLGGFGGSDLPARAAFSAYADDLVDGLRQLAAGDVVLVGHSLGGGIATALAERHRHRVRALVLLAPAGFGRIPLAEAISLPGVRTVAGRLLPRALGHRGTVAASYRTFVTPGLAPTEDLLARFAGDPTPRVAAAVTATKAVVRAGTSRYGFARRRVEYDGPVTAVWGSRDLVVPPAHADGVRRGLPQADIRHWPGMGHHPQRERPDELAQLVETCARAAARRRARRSAA